MAVSGGVGIILGVRSIGNNENLHILIQTACRPKAISLIAFDLVKGFPDGNTTALQLHMNQRQTVHQNGHIIAGIVAALGFLVLVDHLQTVVVNVLFVYELNILGSSVIPAQYLYMVGLDGAGFLNDTLVSVGKGFGKEPLPFVIGKGVAVEKLQLPSKVFDQARFAVNGKIFVALRRQQTDKFLFKSRFALETVRA